LSPRIQGVDSTFPSCTLPSRCESPNMVRKFLAVAASFAVMAFGNVHAVVFFSTGDPAKNITAPGGPLAGSGWQFQGEWGATLGTPIAPNYFITASHIGGTEGDSFVFSGSTYPTTGDQMGRRRSAERSTGEVVNVPTSAIWAFTSWKIRCSTSGQNGDGHPYSAMLVLPSYPPSCRTRNDGI